MFDPAFFDPAFFAVNGAHAVVKRPLVYVDGRPVGSRRRRRKR